MWEIPQRLCMEESLKTYDTKLDSKKRLTIRNPLYEYYHVTEYDNGVVVLEPRKLVDPLIISKKTLESMDKTVSNLEKGVRYGPVKAK